MKNQLLILIYIILIFGLTFSQTGLNQSSIPQNTSARYVSGQDGTLKMYVNVWGHVKNPGRILVDHGIDLSTLLSLSGGPHKGINLKKVKVYHEYPDKDGKIVHVIDLTEFIERGDRSNFIDIQPNDTFIIKQTAWSYFIEEIGTVNTLMNLLNIYLNLSNLLANSSH